MNPTPQATLARRLLLALACVTAMVPSVWSQTTDAATKPDGDKAVPVETTTSAPAKKLDDKVVLSPFVVTTSKDSGYYAENTLMGSRLNSKISDLASSITVVTKQQLDDTGALDINDVFLFEANTEGAATYTPVALNRNNVTDNIGGYSGDDGSAFGIATANRVRGLGRVDTAQNNYPTIARLAFDAYNTNSVEISRGPNSNLFGTGAPAGIINQSSASAVLGQQHTEVQLRGGSFGAWRASANANVPIGDKVAIYVAGLYDSRGFERKPSEDLYRRQYGAITFQPFKKTTITANYENYDNYNQRPNYLELQDRVTPWLSSGRPGFNPTTQLFTFLDGGATAAQSQPYLNSTLDARYVAGVTPSADASLTTSTGNPFFINGVALLPGRQTLMYDGQNLVGFWVPNASNGSGTFNVTVNGVTGALPVSSNQTQAQRVLVATRLTQSAAPLVPIPAASTGANQYAVWILPDLTNKSIYDYTKYNVSGQNYGYQRANTANIELQQQILPNLNFSAGWFRQRFTETYHYPLGQANQAPRLYVDTNNHNLDGTVNPYFGSPYVFDSQADTFYSPETNTNWRAMLSYELDLTGRASWLRFLGRHRFLGFWSEQDQWKNNLRYRLSYTSGDGRFMPNLATPAATGLSFANSAASIQRIYYLGQNQNGIVTHGLSPIADPGYGGPTSAPLSYYNWNTGSWAQTTMNYADNLFYAGANYGITTRKDVAKQFVWQGYIWDERIIPTMGWRKDDVDLRASVQSFPTSTSYISGFAIQGLESNLQPKRAFDGTTKTRGIVTRLFKGWDPIEKRANNGNVVADMLRNLSFHYNDSDNFNPPAGLQVDFFNKVLPAPTGTGKDYGFGMSMFHDKLVFRLNWYKATNSNALSNSGNTVVGRLQRMDTTDAHRWAEYVVRIRNGQNPQTDQNFDNNTVNPLSPAEQSQIADLQFGTSFALRDFNWPSAYNGSINSTENNLSRGKEFELTFNPTKAWTMKVTAGEQTAQYSSVAPEVQAWIAYRKPQWIALTAPDLPTELTKFNGNKLLLSNFWNGYGFTQGSAFDDAPSNTAGGTGTPNATYVSIVDAVNYVSLALQNQDTPNLRKWSYSYLTSYTVQTGRLRGFTFGGQFSWSSDAVAGYQSLLDPTTYAHPNATTTQIVFPDLTKPITTPSINSVSLFAAYQRKIFADKVRMKIQLNVRDAFESGGLQAVVFNQDGSPAQYRIKDPRQWFVTTTFDF